MINYTPGGSPIFAPRISQKPNGPQGKIMYACILDENHKLSAKKAAASGYMCSRCGAELKVRKVKIAEMHSLAQSLGFAVTARGAEQ